MPTYTLTFTDTAKACLLEIAEYIAQDNPERANSFIADLVETLNKTLSIFPHSGKVYYKTTKHTIRAFPYGNYIAYYDVNDQQRRVVIQYIFHSKRHINDFIDRLS